MPTQILKTHTTPQKLFDYVAKTRQLLKLQANDRNEAHFENNPNLYRRGIAGYIYYYNFIMNRVPSDIYQFKNPKYGANKENIKDSLVSAPTMITPN